jgi:hypothetical protein
MGMMCAYGLVGTSPDIPPGSAPENIITSVKVEISIPSIPKVGEVFEATLTIYCKNDLEPDRLGRPGPDYKATFEGDVEIIAGREHVITGSLKKGETRTYKAKMLIKEAKKRIGIGGGIVTAKRPQFAQGANIEIFLIDPETGQYGTKKEYEGKLPVEYRYDPLVGTFTCSPSQNPAPIEENRRIIKMIKELEPLLNDSLALLLHSEQYRVGVPKGIAQWDSLNQRWIDKGVYEYYLKDGWFKALQEGKIEQWREGEKKKIESGWKGGRFNFFRLNNDRGGGDYTACLDTFYKTCDGVWKFKDHLYNKDQGLLTQADKKGIKQGRARVLTTYVSGGSTYRKLSHQCVTNDTGYFSVTIKLPSDATLAKAFAIIYPCGGGLDTTAPMISVSDSTPTSVWYNKDPLDTTLYVIKNMYYKDIYPNTLPVHFDSVYADTYPEVVQPQSGCINIYETYLHARTFMNPPPNWPLRVMWEPGYDGETRTNMRYPANNDTIWVTANASNYPDSSTDEWDDDILLHEFGHYVMKRYAQGPPTDSGGHAWPISYPEIPGIGYGEGWAEFFSCRARVGTGTDSLIVNTKKGIGAGAVYLWHNIENPWIESYPPPEYFQGGPWCEGAVAGVLWDIYDSHNEDPYPSYPWPGFPDTGLRDTLSMGINPIWDVFDHYDPVGEPTNCWTIFHFRSGWNYYNYDHAFALNQILLHHRIRDTIPAAPTGLSAKLILVDVRLYWHKNSEPDLQGYRVFRRDSTIMNPTPMWTSWALLVEKNTDTTHLDTTTVSGGKYRYRLTAFDSLGNESGYSDSVTIKVGAKGDIDKQQLFGLTKTIVRDVQSIEFFIPEGRKEVFVKVYDCCGRIVNKQRIHVGSNNLCEISLKNSRFDHLPSGVYFLSLETDKSDKIVEKFVIIK